MGKKAQTHIVSRTIIVIVSCILVGSAICNSSQPMMKFNTLASLRGLEFDQFVEAAYIILLKRTPEEVTAMGMDAKLGMNGDQLNDISPQYIAESQGLESGIFDLLQQYDRNRLSEDQKLKYDIFYWFLDDLVKGHAFTYKDYPINTIVWSMNVDLTIFFTDICPVTNVQEAEYYITRLGKVKQKFDQLIEGLQLREENGVILPTAFIQWVLPDLADVAFSDPELTEFYTSFNKRLDLIQNMPDDEKQALLDQTAEAISASVLPAFRELYEYYLHIRSRAPREIGIGFTPNGHETYAYFLRHFSTTDWSVAEIHQLGLDELQGIHNRMYAIFKELGYPQDASLYELYKRVESDGGILSGEAIYDEHVRLINYAKELTADSFNIMPEMDVVVVADPVGGFYDPPAYDGSRPGMFFAQVTGKAPYLNLPSLTFHETIPGHHYQYGIIPQLHLPLFQTFTSFTGYSEGWALYAEHLMWELGAYRNDPYGELGYLRYQALRAARMVVDTGINGLDWTFEEAVNFMTENVGCDESYSKYEVARMATVPGQSSSYYIGYLTILDLRKQMQDALGDDFDIKEFHDLILDHGAMPLVILQQYVGAYIQHHGN